MASLISQQREEGSVGRGKLRTEAICFLGGVDVQSSSLRHLQDNTRGEALGTEYMLSRSLVCTSSLFIPSLEGKLGTKHRSLTNEEKLVPWSLAERKHHRHPFFPPVGVFWSGSCCMTKCEQWVYPAFALCVAVLPMLFLTPPGLPVYLGCNTQLTILLPPLLSFHKYNKSQT